MVRSKWDKVREAAQVHEVGHGAREVGHGAREQRPAAVDSGRADAPERFVVARHAESNSPEFATRPGDT